MIFHRIFTSALLLFALSVFAGAARAADISLFVGAELPGSIKYEIPGLGADMKLPLDNGPVYGLRYGSNFTRYLDLEHTLAISPDFLFPSESISISGPCTPTIGVECPPPTVVEWKEAKGFLYSGNLVLNFPDMDDRMVPFLTAGIGLVHQYGDRDMPVGTKLAFNYGGGVKFPNIAGPLGARADLRGYRAGMFSKSVNIFELSVGLMVSFGR
jgi:hypothetical protein